MLMTVARAGVGRGRTDAAGLAAGLVACGAAGHLGSAAQRQRVDLVALGADDGLSRAVR